MNQQDLNFLRTRKNTSKNDEIFRNENTNHLKDDKRILVDSNGAITAFTWNVQVDT